MEIQASGDYDFAALEIGPRGWVTCEGPCRVRIAGRLSAGAGAYIGPAEGLALAPADVEIFVLASGGQAVAALGPDSEIRARLYAPNGAVTLGPKARAVGRLVARTVELGPAARLRRDEHALVVERFAHLPWEPAAPTGIGEAL